MAAEPQQLEREIEQTREQLGRDVDALAEKVSPKAAARRGVDRVKSAATSIRENVMGSTSEATSSVKDTAASAKESVASAGESVAGAAQSATQTVRRQATGNPLAAGVIAFGVGWLVSSLIPATRAEEEAGQKVREVARERGGEIRERLSSEASELADNLREPAKEAMGQVRQTAAEAASNVKDETTHQAKQATSDRTIA